MSTATTTTTLGELLRRAAASERGVRFLDRHERPELLSYAQLHRRALRVASALRDLGLRPGERVALILPTAPSFYDGFFGALLAGLVPVPLYPPVRLGLLGEYHQRTAAMLSACGARVVLSDPQIRRILGPTVERARPDLGCLNVEALASGPADPQQAAASPDDVAFIQFSSGTTQAPKPICLTHRQVLANVELIRAGILASYPEGPELVHHGVCWLPLYHDMGLVGCVLASLAHPADLTLIPPELFVARPAVWLRAISRWRGTISPAPNFAYGLCVDRIDDEELEGVDLSCWRVALNGAEPVTPTVLRRFVERFSRQGLRPEALTPVYGLAEATLAVTFSEMHAAFEARTFDQRLLSSRGEARPAAGEGGVPLVNLGRPLPGFSLRIAGESGEPLEEGRVGRVLVKGPSVMRGYLGRPAATAAAMPGGWLDTGDEGFLHAGDLYIYGRNKDIVILNGRNHAPQQFEQLLDDVAGVRVGCTAAIGVVPAGGDGERLVLLVEQARGSSVPDARLREEVAARIGERTGVAVERVVLLAPGTLPRTSSGKIRRSEARRRYLAGTLLPPKPVNTPRMLLELARSGLAYLRAAALPGSP